MQVFTVGKWIECQQ